MSTPSVVGLLYFSVLTGWFRIYFDFFKLFEIDLGLFIIPFIKFSSRLPEIVIEKGDLNLARLAAIWRRAEETISAA